MSPQNTIWKFHSAPNAGGIIFVTWKHRTQKQNSTKCHSEQNINFVRCEWEGGGSKYNMNVFQTNDLLLNLIPLLGFPLLVASPVSPPTILMRRFQDQLKETRKMGLKNLPDLRSNQRNVSICLFWFRAVKCTSNIPIFLKLKDLFFIRTKLK